MRHVALAPSVLEDWMETFLDEVDWLDEFPRIRVVRRDASNVVYDEWRLGSKTVVKRMSKSGSRAYVGLIYCIIFCHKLLTTQRTATQRELYYYYKGGGWSPWSTQDECNDSIADVAAMFDVDRIALGLKTMPRGYVAGRLRVRKSPADDWVDLRRQPQPITMDWVTPRSLRSDARCIVVVEKDGVFQRLVDDRFCDRFPCVLVTGVGVPDIPTRACVFNLRKALDVPVYALVDYNAWGLGIILVYAFGSARLGNEAYQYAVPDLVWLGLRTSQVRRLQLPATCMQPLTDTDTKKALDLLQHPALKPHWADELKAQLDHGLKCELETLLQSDMDRISTFIPDAILHRDFLA